MASIGLGGNSRTLVSFSSYRTMALSAPSGGNLVEWADNLGNNVGNNQIFELKIVRELPTNPVEYSAGFGEQW